MALTPNPAAGTLVGDNSAELIALTPGQLQGFALGVVALEGNDTVIGSADGELINSNQGEDELSGGQGGDTLFGGQGNDLLDGQAGNDFLFGNLDADLLRGGKGDDNLFGGQDNDMLFGDDGNDLLDGGLGIDVITSGKGVDTFVLARRGADVDFFSDFEDGVDRMQLPAAIGFGDLQIQARDGNQTVIVFGGEELAVIDGIAPSGITEVDFIGSNPEIGEPNPGNGSGGDPSNRDGSVIVRLDQGILYDPKFNSPIKIMPLGDSITQGQVGSSLPEAEQEGYRLGLWNRLTDFGFSVDFVGSKSNGSANLPDRDHEGHPGYKASQLTEGKQQDADSGVDNWIPAANPDVILLMAGTNNSGNTADRMIQDLDNLIGRILDEDGFTGELLVASIPPIRPDGRFAERIPNVEAYDAQIPGLIDGYVQEGKTVTFVNMFSGPKALTPDDITAPPEDNGLHPTVEGYDKIAQFWFNELLGRLGTVEPLADVNVAIGSNFDDVLVGSSGNNSLEGGGGNDRITGGEGGDVFFYGTPDAGADILLDFDRTEGDTIGLFANNFGGGLVGGTALSAAPSATGSFVAGGAPNPVGTGANFLYNTSSGELSFDVDGTGSQSAVLLATLTGAPELSAAQFSII